MTNSPQQMPSTWRSRNRLLFFAGVTFLVFMPKKVTDTLFVAFLAVVALRTSVDAVVILIRTRWYFRVGGELIYVATIAAVISTTALKDDGWLRTLMTFGLVMVVVVWSLISARIEQRWYPRQVLAFKNAQTAAGRWGWLTCRQIPRLPDDGQE